MVRMLDLVRRLEKLETASEMRVNAARIANQIVTSLLVN
jgi:hypothetical protein